MHPVEGIVFLVLLAITAILLGFAVFYPEEGSVVAPRARHRHVFRLPQGSRRQSDTRWTWSNDTVLARFRVFTGHPTPPGQGHKPQADHCCGALDGRLFGAEPYEIEAGNDGSFSASQMRAVFADAASRWEAIVGNHFGDQSSVSESAGLVFNGRNQVGLGELDVNVPNALAVTGLWMVCPGGGGIATCPTKLEIAEWDQTYAISERTWGLGGELAAYDLPSVAIHEFGHNVGLDDLADDACAPSTMYGFAAKGETLRRSIDSVTAKCAREHYGLSGAASPAVDWRGVAIVSVLLALF